MNTQKPTSLSAPYSASTGPCRSAARRSRGHRCATPVGEGTKAGEVSYDGGVAGERPPVCGLLSSYDGGFATCGSIIGPRLPLGCRSGRR